MTYIDKIGNDCRCYECGNYFGMPTGGGACPHCGSKNWREI